jgi:hypothetical protein
MDVDIFIIQGHCQYQKNRSTTGYQNRFNIGDTWYTMPVKHGEVSIVEKEYIEPVKNFKKIIRRLPQYTVLNEMLHLVNESLFSTNNAIIKFICERLSIKTPLVNDYPTDLLSSERLINICKGFKCDEYLSGNGARAYLDIGLFEKNGIKVSFQDSVIMIKRPILEMLK